MLSGALAKQRVQDLSLAEQERAKRRENSGRIVQKYGEIYVYQGRKDIEEDDKDEAKVVNMRNARASKPWKARYKKLLADWSISDDAMDAQARLKKKGLNLWSYDTEVWLRLKHQE